MNNMLTCCPLFSISFSFIHRYKTLATQKRTWLAVSVCWILSCLLGFIPLFGWHNYSPPASNSTNSSASSSMSRPCTFLSVISLPFMVYFNFLGCVMAPLLVMMLLYARIFWSLQGRLKESYPQVQASLLREKRLACSLALVLFLFASCWIPLHLMNCLLLIHGPQAVTQGTLYTGDSSFSTLYIYTFILLLFVYMLRESVAYFLHCFYYDVNIDQNTYQVKNIYVFPGILLSHANSAINPVVYAYRIPKIRQAYSQICRRFFMGPNCCHGDKHVSNQ